MPTRRPTELLLRRSAIDYVENLLGNTEDAGSGVDQKE